MYPVPDSQQFGPKPDVAVRTCAVAEMHAPPPPNLHVDNLTAILLRR